MKKVLLISMVLGVILVGCSFSEYSQTADLAENIDDDYRTGCEVDVDTLMAEYKQYEANQSYIDWSFGEGTPQPTPTPSPITASDRELSAGLIEAWKSGCIAGRTDVVGARQATIMGLKDELELLSERIAALEPTPAPATIP